MKEYVLASTLALTLLGVIFVTQNHGVSKSGAEIGMCMSDCASEQGICISQCNGDGQCIGRCASAHGRCVSRCN